MRSPIQQLDPARPPLRWLLRFPSLLYGAKLGWLLGERFVELTVRGRKTSLPRRVILEVIGRNPSTNGLVVASAWGPRAEWFRNLEVFPHAEVRLARRRFAAAASRLEETAAAEALHAYAQAHPRAYRWLIGPLLLGQRPAATAAEFAALARSIPILELTPADASHYSAGDAHILDREDETELVARHRTFIDHYRRELRPVPAFELPKS